MSKSLKAPSLFKLEIIEKANRFVLVAIPVIVLLLVSLPHITTGYDEDEVFSVTNARSLTGLFHLFALYENNMSLYHILLHFWMKVFGETEAATRAMSLLFAVITIPVFFRLERVWLNKTSSFFGALLLAVSPLFVYFSVELRSYSLLVLAVTVSTFLFVKLLQTPSYKTALWYGLIIGVSVYIHYFAVLIVLVHALTLTRKNGTKRYFSLFATAASLAAFIVLPLILFPPKNKGQIDWLTRPDLKSLWYAFSALVASGYVIFFIIIALFIIIGFGYWKKETVQDYFPEKLSLVWALVPVMLIFIFSYFIKPVFVTFYFVWCTPGVVLLICLVVAHAGSNTMIKSVVWILLLCIFTKKSILFFRNKGSGFRDAVSYLHTQATEGQTVLVYPYFWSLDIDFYLDKTGSSLSDERPLIITQSPFLMGGGGQDPLPDLDIVRKAAHRAGKIFLFCVATNDASPSDIKQNRIWLSRIRMLLVKEHPVQEEKIFGKETQCPVRILIYE